MTRQSIDHPFPPLYNQDSEILILGSFPSVKSREQMFFYGHPQNRFWKVLAALAAGEDDYREGIYLPGTIEEKKEFLFEHRIALWDVIGHCEIEGSSDSSIRDVRPNDLTPVLRNAKIRTIYANGAKSFQVYNKYQFPVTGRVALKLPSTSPANAAWSIKRLVSDWRAAGVLAEGTDERRLL